MAQKNMELKKTDQKINEIRFKISDFPQYNASKQLFLIFAATIYSCY